MRATLCFADPPWSQPGLQWYKEETDWPLFLSDRPLAEDVTEILTRHQCQALRAEDTSQLRHRVHR